MFTAESVIEHGRTCEQRKKNLGFDGPWMREENLVIWKHLDLVCFIKRDPIMLHWCGYVAVPKGHPAYGSEGSEFEVHGGITFSRNAADLVWWLGFDCAHAGDLVPSMKVYAPAIATGIYRTQDFARSQTEQLARQVAALKEGRNAGRRLERAHGEDDQTSSDESGRN